MFIPIPKKGDLLQRGVYCHRTIALFSNINSVLLFVILYRMRSKLADIDQEQADNRPNRGTRDQITNIRIIMWKVKGRNMELFFIFSTSINDFTWYGMIKCG